MTTPTPTPADELRDRIAQALAADDGHPWDTLSKDAQQHYRDNADAVLAVLREPVAHQVLGTPTTDPAPALEPQDHPGADLFVALQAAGLDDDEANRRMYAYAAMVLRQEKATASAPAAPADRAADRRDRYAAAILDALARDTTHGPHWGAAADAAMTVADSEQYALRAEVLRERAAFLERIVRESLDPDSDPSYCTAVRDVALGLRRLADEAQPTAEADPACGRCFHAPHFAGLCRHFAGTAGACQCPTETETREGSYLTAEHDTLGMIAAKYGGDPFSWERANPWVTDTAMPLPAGLCVAIPTPEPTETGALCGNTVGVSGLHYRPCARPAGHPEAYCRDTTGQHLFLDATAATEEPQP